MKNSPRRKEIIQDMLEIIQSDSPWIWGFHPKSFSLSHGWVENTESNLMANNTLKYKEIINQKRLERIKLWNKPNFSLLYFLFILILGILISVLYMIRKKDKEKVYD